MMKKSCLTAAGATALVILLGQSSQVFGSAYYYTRSYYKYDTPDYVSREASDNDASYVHYDSGASGDWLIGLSLERGEGYAASSGRADAANLNLGAHTWAISMQDTYRAEGSMLTKASNSFTVTPGTSGLSNGDAVTLELGFGLDGSLFVAGTPHPGTSGSASADMSAGLTIRDEYSNQIAGFDASGEMWGITSWLMSSGDFLFSSGWEENWQTSTGLSHTDSDRLTQSGGGEKVDSHSFNTGWLTLEFETFIGQSLFIDASLNTHVATNEEAKARADFYNTLAFGVTSQAPGVEIDWEIDPHPVPLPGALPLLGSGLLGLLGLRRKRARNQG